MKKLNRKIKFTTNKKQVSSMTKGFGMIAVSGLLILLCCSLVAVYEYSNALLIIKSQADKLTVSADDQAVRILSKSYQIKKNSEIEEIKSYLKETEYIETNKGPAGSFWIDQTNNTFKIISNYSEYSDLNIQYQNGKVLSLQNLKTGERLQAAELEPLLLRSYLPTSDPQEIGAIIHEKVTCRVRE